jgi:sialate O-acetylesterase
MSASRLVPARIARLWSAPLFCLVVPASAAVSLPPLFSDHAVLQRSSRAPIWGRADSGEQITIKLGSTTAHATADENGRWTTSLDLSRSEAGPTDLVVRGSNSVTVTDVVVGEVWLASGQSNMEWLLKATTGSARQIAASANPLLRQFRVTKAESAVPLKNVDGKWTVASPETSGEFTAVGYYFGRDLQQTLKAPVGIIHSSWGGTAVETWTSKETLDSVPEFKIGAEKSEDNLRTYSRRVRTYLRAFADWQDAHQRKDRASTGVPSAGAWHPATVPGKLSGPGATWLRCKVQISASQAGKTLTINTGELRGIEQVYWNGVRVGETSFEQSVKNGYDRRHVLAAAQVTEGEATIAFRVFNATDDIVFYRGISVASRATGGWEQQSEFILPPFTADLKASLPAHPGREPQSWDTASHLYNAMIHPLVPYAIKGVIWYQGESNVGRAYQYRQAFPLLIQDWRARWNQPDLPFYFCQLASMGGKSAQPGDTNWAELREAQSLTLALPHTGQAVLIDVGEANDIHPRNKQDVGARLAALALAQTYGKSVPFSGPVYKSMKIDGGKIALSFQHVGRGLAARPLPPSYDVNSSTGETAPLVRNTPASELEGFAICGADRKWVWADAKIAGDQVVVSSSHVSAPVAVRYGWAMNPTCNLTNDSGLPASPFRTDDFPLTSQTATY